MRRRSRARSSSARAVVLLAAALGLSGPGVAAPATTATTHTVVMEAVAFQPEVLTVKAGDTIVWVNKDAFPHTATAPRRFDSKSIAADGSWKFTARARGEFAYVCTFHPTMKGTLRVE